MAENMRDPRYERMDRESESPVVADRKPCLGDRLKRVPVRVASAGDLLPQRGQDILRHGKDPMVGADMLIKGQHPARPQDPARFSQGSGLVNDAAQNKASDYRVSAFIGSRDSLRGPATTMTGTGADTALPVARARR